MRFSPSPADFSVEEVPLALPSGSGAHLWLEIEKRLLSTPEALRRIAARLGVSAAGIGHAGLKDAHARTTQWISIAGAFDDAPVRAGDERIRVLRAARHGAKLALGALLGNRFRLVLRDVTPEEALRLSGALDRLARDGCPNFFGAQRFGIRGLGAAIGKAILVGEPRLALDWLLGCPRPVEGERLRQARARYERGDLPGALRGFPESFAPERAALHALLSGAPPAGALAEVPFKARELYLSAYQSELFNRLLCERVAAGTVGTIEPGDAVARDYGDPAPAGPLFGWAVERAGGAPGAREEALLRAEGISLETFRRTDGLDLRGARKPYRFPVRDLAREAEPDGPGTLALRFFLPPGCYATTVVDELIRGGPGTPPPDLPARQI